MLVKNEKALKICNDCFQRLGLRKQSCAFRSFDNECCDRIIAIEKAELLKQTVHKKLTKEKN